ncbi:MAG: (2Fe-2S)-binding protein [Peptococcaceae bacterium]|nr:(2Fe-2S)-binding protein [Peptococcaceae bacterium]
MNPVSVCGANPQDTTTARCPVCNTPGKKVRPETIKNLLNKDKIPGILEGYNLCLSRDCDVVYFGRQIFRKNDVKVRVWYKETEHPIPVCYCKDVTERDIIDHIAVRGCCNDLKDIQEHTGANTGKECLTKNPAGT